MAEDYVLLEWDVDEKGVHFNNINKTNSKGPNQSKSSQGRHLITKTPTLLWGSELADKILNTDAQVCVILHKSVVSHIIDRVDIRLLINRLLQSGSGIIVAALPRQFNALTGINAEKLPDCENRTCIGNLPDVRAIVGFKSALAYWLNARLGALQRSPGQDLIVFWSEVVLLSSDNIGDSPQQSPPVEVDIFGSMFPPMPSNSDPIGVDRSDIPKSSKSSDDFNSSFKCLGKCKTWCSQNQKVLWLFGIGLLVLIIIIAVVFALTPTSSVSSSGRRTSNNDYYINPAKGGAVTKGPILSRDPSSAML